MAVDRRRRNVEWNLSDGNNHLHSQLSYLYMHSALLMDIRDELKRLNALLHCHNFIGMPATLRTISRKIPARRKAKRA